jgi:hypothetical protein
MAFSLAWHCLHLFIVMPTLLVGNGMHSLSTFANQRALMNCFCLLLDAVNQSFRVLEGKFLKSISSLHSCETIVPSKAEHATCLRSITSFAFLALLIIDLFY